MNEFYTSRGFAQAMVVTILSNGIQRYMKRLLLMLEMEWILTLALGLVSFSASCDDTIWLNKDGGMEMKVCKTFFWK